MRKTGDPSFFHWKEKFEGTQHHACDGVCCLTDPKRTYVAQERQRTPDNCGIDCPRHTSFPFIRLVIFLFARDLGDRQIGFHSHRIRQLTSGLHPS